MLSISFYCCTVHFWNSLIITHQQRTAIYCISLKFTLKCLKALTHFDPQIILRERTLFLAKVIC